jgi:hypothetical protein
MPSSPLKPLALIYNLKMVVNTIILWLKKENQTELDPAFVASVVNLSILDVAEIISGAGGDDYGKTAVITDISSSVSNNMVKAVSYTDSSLTVNSPSHSLTILDIGKRIALWSYVAANINTYVITIDGNNGTYDTATVKLNGTNLFTGHAINALIFNSLTAAFPQNTGHTIGDNWTLTTQIISGTTHISTPVYAGTDSTTPLITTSITGSDSSLPMPEDLAAIAAIAGIVDANNFTITIALGQNFTNNLNYAIFSAFSASNIDLTQFPISHITKLTDSISMEVIKVGDREFDNLYRFDEKQNKIFWFKHGQTLFLYKGTAIPAFGELTLFFDSYPQRAYNDTDLLDIRDMYIPLVIAKAKNYCLEHLGIEPPEQLQNAIDAKTASIRDTILREKQIIDQKASKNS